MRENAKLTKFRLCEADGNGLRRLIDEYGPSEKAVTNFHAALADHRARFGKLDELLAVTVRDLSQVLLGYRTQASAFLDEVLLYMEPAQWIELSRRGAFRPRIALDAHITIHGNLSVRFAPDFLGKNGRWTPAPEWRPLRFLGHAAIMQRPNDEVLFMRNVSDLFRASRVDDDYILSFRHLSSFAVNLAFWIVYRRLSEKFDVHLGRYVAALSKQGLLSSFTDHSASPIIGLELVDAVEEHHATISGHLADFSEETGYSVDDFWHAAEQIKSTDMMSGKLRKTTGPASKLTPSVVEKYVDLLRVAIDYGIFRPSPTRKSEPGHGPSAWSAYLPPPPTAGSGDAGTSPAILHPSPKQIASAPIYNARTYSASGDELAGTGLENVGLLVSETNRKLELSGRPAITQADYPTTRKKFEKLMKRWRELSGLAE
jgi:hypothetical protein